MQRVWGSRFVGVAAALGVASAAQAIAMIGGCGSAFDDGLSKTDGSATGVDSDGAPTVITIYVDGSSIFVERDASADAASDGPTVDPDGGADATVVDASCGSSCTPVVIASPPQAVTTLDATDDYVTWLDATGLYITSATSAAAPRSVAFASPSGLVVSPTMAYVTRSADDVNPNLIGTSLNNGAGATAAQNTPLGSIAYMSDAVFTTPVNASSITKWNAADLTNPTPVLGIGGAGNLHASNGVLYYTNSGTVYACEAQGCTTPRTLFTEPLSKLYAVDPQNDVFWATNGSMFGCNSASHCPAPAVALASVGTVTGIASDGTHLYWADSSTPGIFRAKITSTLGTVGVQLSLSAPEQIAPGSDSVTGMAFNSSFIFWAQGVNAPVIYRLPR